MPTFSIHLERAQNRDASRLRGRSTILFAEDKLPRGYHWSIEVNILADNVAVATYTSRWYASSMFETAMVTTSDKAVRDGRGTQVFVLDPDGKSRIVHEHLSDIWRDASITK